MKMCEYIEQVLGVNVSLNNIFTLYLKFDIDSSYCFGTFLCLSPLTDYGEGCHPSFHLGITRT